MADIESAVVRSLARNGVSTSAALQRDAGASPAAFSRAIAALGDRVVRIDGSRGTRYGLRREVPHVGFSWPLNVVGPDGTPRLLGRLHALARDQYWFDSPLGEHPQLSDGLPFFLQDLIPQGFLGRSLPARFPELGLPSRVEDWNDDHVLLYLSRRSEDCIGDLVVGEESLKRLLNSSDITVASSIAGSQREDDYPRLAAEAMAGRHCGSVAGGQHPKFTASIRRSNSLERALVKFSPAGNAPSAQRWSDLLVCEHVATRVLNRAGLTSTTTALFVSHGRTFIEAPRFDRVDSAGRLGLVSLAALSNVFLGAHDTWAGASDALAQRGLVSSADVEIVRRLWTFGRLIANTDMHFGNLSFHLRFEGTMPLAPVYDMLPMLYAPVAGDVVATREFEVPLPSSENVDIWKAMASLAEGYWREVADHKALSTGFAAIAKTNAGKIAQARRIATPAR